MKPQKIKDRCTKRKYSKCEDIVRTYDKIQTAYAAVLEQDDAIASFQCNVALEGLEEGAFTSDFVCIGKNGDIIVQECVFRKKLTLPRTCKLLDSSRNYWMRRGVTDWAIVVETEEITDEKE